MLTHPTVDKLQQLRCAGMAQALVEQLDSSEVVALSFEERLGLLVDREITEHHSRQLTNRLRRARLKHDACLEAVDFRHRRGLDKPLVLWLADGRWSPRRPLDHHHQPAPVEKWHDVIGDPTLADAILDRLVHNPIDSN